MQMDNKIKKTLTIENFIIFYMVVMVLSTVSLIPQQVISIFNVFFYIVGTCLSVYVLYKVTKQKKQNFTFYVLLFFLISYLLTIAVNHTNIGGNLKSFAITLIQCVLSFYYIKTLETVKFKQFMKRFLNIFVVVMFIITTLSLICFFLNIVFVYGYLRYNGLFLSANDSALCVLAAAVSCLLLRSTKNTKLRIYYTVCTLIQILFVPLTVSRGAEVFFYASFGLICVVFVCLLKKTKTIKLALGCCLLAGIFVSYQMVSYVMPKAQGIIAISQGGGNSSKEEEEIFTSDRHDYDESSSIRLNMLQAGFHSFLNHPVFGTTSRSMAKIVQRENPNLALQGIEGAGVHNTYMQVLVSNGLLGFASIAVIVLSSLWQGIKNAKKNVANFYVLAILLSLLVYMNFSVLLLYFSGPVGILFWVLLAAFSREEDKEIDMSKLEKINDTELKTIQLKILKEIASFCEKNEIKYSIFYGTMIGVVRHKGYIPWDDDIDIALPRPDYDKLLATFTSDSIKIGSFNQNEHFTYTYAKAYDPKTLLIENANTDKAFELGVNIDIFPLDPMFDDKTKKRHNLLSKILDVKLIRLSKERSIIKNLSLCLLKVVAFPFTKKYLIKKLMEYSQTIKYEDTNMDRIRFLGVKFHDNGFPKNSFDVLVKMPFENLNVCVCQNYDEILSVFYGDYMKFPPKEQQVTHHSFTAYYK